jgi:hypothetical protein
MISNIRYGGILIKDILTDSVRADVVKDSTGVDQLGVRYTVTGTGIVHMAAQDHTGHRVNRIQTDLLGVIQALSKDRRPFAMDIGGLPFIRVWPGAAEPNAPPGTTTTKLDLMDIDNGPIPSIVVTKITAGVSANIQFTFTFTIPNCGGPGTTTGSGLVNFRFWIAEFVNAKQNWLTTRTYQGKIRVAHKNVNPHALSRVVTIPPLQNGFRRDIIRWDESENGLELSFAFEDQEIVAAPPYNKFNGTGATAWSGRLTHSTDTLGATSLIEGRVRLEGPKGTSVLELADIAIRVISQKIQYVKLVRGAQAYFLHFSIAEELADNIVECEAVIRHTGNQRDFIGLFSLENSPVIGQPMGDLGIGYDSNIVWQPGLSAPFTGLYTSILQTPCQPGRMPQAAAVKGQKYKSQTVSGSGQSNAGMTAMPPSTASPSQLDHLYFDYRLDSEYHMQSGRIALPTGAAANSAEPSIAVVNLFRPVTIREVRIEASRLNKPPELPTPNVAFRDLNGVLHTPFGEIDLCASAPQLSADSRNLLYETKLSAWYAMDQSLRSGQKIPVGTVPYRRTSGSDAARSLPPEIFLPPQNLLT